MPRQKRLNVPGAIFHVIARGLDRQTLFRDDADRSEFLSRFSESLKKTKSLCYAWSLMPNHVHLMVRCAEFPLNDLMRSPLTGYAVYFNRRHRRTGYLYQNRYKSVLCQEEPYFLELVRYIHLNPLRAGLVKSMEELNRFPWTGHRALLGKSRTEWQSTGEVLSRFAKGKKPAIHLYTQFLRDGIGTPAPDLTGGGLRRSAGGWSGVFDLKAHKEYWRGDERILGDGDFVNHVLEAAEETLATRETLRRAGWDLNKVIARACEAANTRPGDVFRRGRENAVAKAKGLAAYWATRTLGISGEAVGRALRLSRQSVLVNARKGQHIADKENIKLLC